MTTGVGLKIPVQQRVGAAVSETTAAIGDRSAGERVACVVAATAVTIVVAAASYRWFERPIMRLRDRVGPRDLREPLPAV